MTEGLEFHFIILGRLLRITSLRTPAVFGWFYLNHLVL